MPAAECYASVQIPTFINQMRRIALILCLLPGLLYAIPATARDYQVEVLVFERATLSTDVEEQWIPGSNSQLSNREMLQDMLVQADDQDFSPTVNRLARLEQELLASGYRVLYTANWQQPSAVFQNAPVVPLVSANSRIQGAIRVYKTSLIFADVALGLTDVLEDPDKPLYFINEKRRLKFKEVHYFDNPRFGTLLTVWPAEG